MKKLIAVIIILSLLVIACDKSPDYGNYNPQQESPQQQYVGGGCGVSEPEIQELPITNNEVYA